MKKEASVVTWKNIVEYVEKAGWIKIQHPNPNLLVYLSMKKDDNDDDIRLVLPNGDGFNDEPGYVNSAVPLLAALEKISIAQMIEKLCPDDCNAELTSEEQIVSDWKNVAIKSISFLSQIREALGVGRKPMLTELPEIIIELVEQNKAMKKLIEPILDYCKNKEKENLWGVGSFSVLFKKEQIDSLRKMMKNGK